MLEQVLKLTCGVTSRINALAKQENLPATALKILILTSYSPFTCVSTLTECTGLQKGRISPLVQELVERGLISRHEGSDRRYSLLRLTPEGNRFLRSLLVDEIHRIEQVFRSADSPSEDDMLDHMRRVAETLGFASEVPATREPNPTT
ncbi:MAG: MarR family winged helix-turn-helix transcriptional regulator [bacterium]|nr:MarR family winged helix-turn-helix transcriptional regulator [bacterium]